jgi:excisionase family DNA binding protein
VPGEGLLTEAEVAELLRVSERTVRRWRAAGTGPSAVRVGKAVRYRRRAVDDWLERPDRQVGPPAEQR